MTTKMKTGSEEFIRELKALAEKYPEETEKYNVMSFIKSAEEVVKYVNGQ